MDCFSVLQDHHAQVFVRLRDVRPKADSSVRLNLSPKGLADGLFTPLALKIGSLSHDLLVEIARCSHAVRLRFCLVRDSVLAPDTPGILSCCAKGDWNPPVLRARRDSRTINPLPPARGSDSGAIRVRSSRKCSPDSIAAIEKNEGSLYVARRSDTSPKNRPISGLWSAPRTRGSDGTGTRDESRGSGTAPCPIGHIVAPAAMRSP